MPTPSSPLSVLPGRSPTARAVSVAGALAASGLTLGLMLLTFHHAGPYRWVPADAEVLAAEAQCRANSGRAAEHRCLSAVLAQRAGAVHLAEAASHGR